MVEVSLQLELEDELVDHQVGLDHLLGHFFYGAQPARGLVDCLVHYAELALAQAPPQHKIIHLHVLYWLRKLFRGRTGHALTGVGRSAGFELVLLVLLVFIGGVGGLADVRSFLVGYL